MACSIDFSALPLLIGCPGASETFMVGNAVGGLDANGGFTVGYGRRSMGDLIACVLQGIKFVFTQLAVPADITVGQTVIRVDQANVLPDSVCVVLDAGVLDRDDDTQVSYLVNYSDGAYPNPGFTITLNQGAKNLQTYVLTYAHA